MSVQEFLSIFYTTFLFIYGQEYLQHYTIRNHIALALDVLLYVQVVVPPLYSNLQYKKGHYFLDRHTFTYNVLCHKILSLQINF